MENILYIGDNKVFLTKYKLKKKYDCVYIDPPYNTGNKFKYNDKMKKEEWKKFLEERIILSQKKAKKNAAFIFSISEDSLFELLEILNKLFKYIYPPFVWQTKDIFNQNKTNSIMSLCHEYILIASNAKIKSNLEEHPITDERLKRYDKIIILKKDIDSYKKEIINGKEVYIIPEGEYEIVKSKDASTSFKQHHYQKRTVQKGHGSERYLKLLKSLDNYNEKTLYFINGVKDKSGLGGKFLLGNSYFQSIKDSVKIKIPSFLGFYQGGIKNFQTAKPIDLMIRIFNAFTNKGDIILDMFGGSGNVSKAINQIDRYFHTCEIGNENENNKGEFIIKQLKNVKNLKIIYEKELENEYN